MRLHLSVVFFVASDTALLDHRHRVGIVISVYKNLLLVGIPIVDHPGQVLSHDLVTI